MWRCSSATVFSWNVRCSTIRLSTWSIGSWWRSLDGLVAASVYVPNGGKDYDAKVRFFSAFSDWAMATAAAGRDVIICGDLNIAREERDVHPKERKLNQIGTRPGGTRDVRAHARRRPGGCRPRARSRTITSSSPGGRPGETSGSVTLAGESITSWRAPALAARATRAVSRREFGTSDHGPVVAEFS